MRLKAVPHLWYRNPALDSIVVLSYLVMKLAIDDVVRIEFVSRWLSLRLLPVTRTEIRKAASRPQSDILRLSDGSLSSEVISFSGLGCMIISRYHCKFKS